MSNGMQVSNYEQSVRARAYEIWESEGRPIGKDFEHWRRSELEMGQEAMRPCASDAPAPAAQGVKRKSRKPSFKRIAAAN